MSFVAIPSLVGPMVGPVAGGLIVTYLDWRGVFYVNVPVGLLGLYFVQRYLPDFREPKSHALDVAGLVLFGGGIALLSYVLEVFGDHDARRRRDPGDAGDLGGAARGLRRPRPADALSPAQSRPVPAAHFPRGGERRVLHPARPGRHPVPVPAALPDRARLLADRLGPAGAAAGGRLDRAEGVHAGHPGAARLSQRAGRQHGRGRPDDHVVRDRGHPHADLADRRARPSSWASSPPCNTPA